MTKPLRVSPESFLESRLWRIVETELNGKMAYIMNRLETCEPDQLKGLQGQLELVKSLLRLPDRYQEQYKKE